MTDIITRLEAATEGSRELDEAIAEIAGRIIPLQKLAHGSLAEQPEWMGGNTANGRFVLFYTTSIDAALTLMPEGWYVKLERYSDGWYADVATTSGASKRFEGTQKPGALALCIAALKARQGDDHG